MAIQKRFECNETIKECVKYNKTINKHSKYKCGDLCLECSFELLLYCNSATILKAVIFDCENDIGVT